MDDDGCFYDHVPGFAGKHVYKVNDEIADALAAADRLLARASWSIPTHIPGAPRRR